MSKRRAFTLLELLVALALLVILLVASSTTVGKRQQSGNVRGAAQAIAGVLAGARQQAIARGTPVAVVVPSQGAITPGSTSLYLAEGWRNPRVVRVVNLARDFPGVFVFAGHWSQASGSYVSAAGLPRPFNHPDFLAGAWGLPAGDQAIIFLPSGVAVGNGLALDGELRWGVVSGYQAVASPEAGVDSFLLQAVGDAYTVRTLASGLTLSEAGLTGAASLPGAPAGQAVPASALQPALAASQSDPHSLNIQCFPAPAEELPPGVDATVRTDGFLTLTVTARDDESDHLRCRWTADAGSAFTATHEVEMEWDETNGLWRAVWCWRPEPDQAGKLYHLECEVVDGRGGLISGTIGASGAVQVLGHGRLVFYSDRDGDQEIFTMNPDGSDLTQLTFDPANDQAPNWSPDGQKIVFSNDTSGIMDLYVMERDGSDVRRVVDAAANGLAQIFWSDFTGTGSQIAFVGVSGAGADVYLVNLDGTDPRTGSGGPWRLTNQAWTGDHWTVRGLSCHLDGERLVVSGGYVPGLTSFGEDLFEVRYYDRTTGNWLATPTVTNLTNTPGVVHAEPDISADGTRLIWYGSAGWAPYHAPPGANGSLGVVTPLSYVESPAWAPDGQRYTYQLVTGTNKDCYIGSVDGSPSVQITNLPAYDDGTHWSPY